MRQLVELKRNQDKFASVGAEIIAVFREEKKGIDGLKMIKEKTGVPFTLALDTPAQQTAAYSSGKGNFSSYVVDGSGKIRAMISGDLRKRAKSAQLIAAINEIGPPTKNESADDDVAAVKRACLDYVEGLYEAKPQLIKRGVHPDLKKFGFGRAKDQTEFRDGRPMTFDQLVELAAKYNADGKRIAADAPKKVQVYDVMDKIATARLDAAWGTDLFHLVKENGRWKILQIVWQSPPR